MIDYIFNGFLFLCWCILIGYCVKKDHFVIALILAFGLCSVKISIK